MTALAISGALTTVGLIAWLHERRYLAVLLATAAALAIHADHFPTPLPSTQSAPITHVSTPVAAAAAGSFIQAGNAS